LLFDRFADIKTEAAEVMHKTGMIDNTTIRECDHAQVCPESGIVRRESPRHIQ
jgi:hypothetical protein